MLGIVAPLAMVNSLFSQDPARYNAASAAGRLIAARQERQEVDAYLRSHTRRDLGHTGPWPGEAARAAAEGVDTRGTG